MKNKFYWLQATILIVVIIVLGLYICVTLGAFNKPEQGSVLAQGFYPMTAYVVQIDEAADTVVIESSTGFLWAFTGIEDWEVGDGCSLIMYDNGTQEIYDDEIVEVRYFNPHPTYL